MRLRHIKGCEEFVNNSEWTITDPKANRGSWQHPIHVEIGMGKGRFIRDMAKLYFDIFYLGIERYKSVIQKTIERKVKEDEERLANGLTGWQLIGGKWYYLNPAKDGTFGSCQLGGVTPDGWTVDKNGAWVESIPRK